jgi:hypothetical protein
LDFDKVTIIQDGKQLATLDARVGDHDQTLGGSLVIRDHKGEAVASVSGGDPNVPSGSVFIRNGPMTITNPSGKFRVRLSPGDELEGEDGGALVLTAGADSGKPAPDGGPPRSAIELNASKRSITVASPAGAVVVSLDGTGSLNLGGGGGSRHGELALFRSDAPTQDPKKATLYADGGQANIWLGGNKVDGDLVVFAKDATDNHDTAQSTFHIDGGGANVWLGGKGHGADLVLFANDAASNHKTAEATVHADGDAANLWLGRNGHGGDLVIFDNDATDNHKASQATFHFDGDQANLWIGRKDHAGDIVLFGKDATDNHDVAKSTVHVDGGKANIWLGGNGSDGDMVLFPSSATDNHDASKGTIHLDGDAGDITLRNADCAEDFDLASDEVEPGSVVSLDDAGRVAACATLYDTRVAGVVSGAGDYRPGIVLDRREEAGRRAAVALMGKVFCKVDARHGPIEVGTLLTTSDTPGYAMRAADPARAFGAVLGKALAPHREGVGLIPVLVALQ